MSNHIKSLLVPAGEMIDALWKLQTSCIYAIWMNYDELTIP